jgi:hypothetical protein
LIFNLSMTTNDAGAGYSFDLLFGNATFGSADFDTDGDVDGADFLVWQRNFGAAGANKSQGDADGNGSVDNNDLNIFKSQYGFLASAAPAGIGAPEPSALAMGVVAIGMATRFGCRRSSRKSA